MSRILLHSLSACLLIAVAAALTGCNGATDDALNMSDKGETGFIHKKVAGSGRVYAVFIPSNYDPHVKYPMIVFLHGMGEGGSDARANLRVGLAPFVAKNPEFPFICLFPQSDSGGWNENSAAANDAITAIDETCAAYSVDKDRISLTGLSTGGYGTWAIGAKYHDKFAALVPMGSSAMDSKDVDVLKDMPIKSFHNSGDMFAASWNDSSMVDKVNDAGGHAEYTQYSAAGHDCWETAYSDGALFAWLAEQRRHGPSANATN